jgi:hypothetical protein
MQPMILGVIPGWCAAPDPESRDSGFDASHRPGMTVLEALFCWLHFSQTLRSFARMSKNEATELENAHSPAMTKAESISGG